MLCLGMHDIYQMDRLSLEIGIGCCRAHDVKYKSVNLSVIGIGHAKEVIICITWGEKNTYCTATQSIHIHCNAHVFLCSTCLSPSSSAAAVIFKLNYTVMMLLSVNYEKSTRSTRLQNNLGKGKVERSSSKWAVTLKVTSLLFLISTLHQQITELTGQNIFQHS